MRSFLDHRDYGLFIWLNGQPVRYLPDTMGFVSELFDLSLVVPLSLNLR